jgi:outer membrane immunogenic protein
LLQTVSFVIVLRLFKGWGWGYFMKRKVLTGLASLTLLDIAAGHAADVARPVYKSQPMAVAAAPSWTGWYFGAHAGYRWGSSDFASLPYAADSPSSNDAGTFATYVGRNHKFKPDGVFGGAHFGYNLQYSPNWLVGLEGDWSWGRSKASVAATGTGIDSSGDGFTFRQNSEITLTWQATLRARAGYVIDRSLWYVTGGVAFARVKWSDAFAATDPTFGVDSTNLAASSSASTVRTGWVVGVGVEQMLAQNFSWRVEYLYEDFGDFTVPQGLGSAGTLDLRIHKVRLGLTFNQ